VLCAVIGVAAMDLATFNLLRERAAAAAGVDVSKVVVTAESANG
jgi:hypothetical protein